MANPCYLYVITDYNREGVMHVDMQDMPFRSNAVGNFVSVFTLEHVTNPEKAIAEASRCLKAGGVFVLAVPFLQQQHGAPFDYTRWTVLGLRELLENHGFKIERRFVVGNRFSTVASLCQEIRGMRRRRRNALVRNLVIAVSRGVGLGALILSYFFPANDEFYSAVVLKGRKP